MSSLAERIYEETRTLADSQASEVLDFIGYLKTKACRMEQVESPSESVTAEEDWLEFEKLVGVWSGKFEREEYYDRSVLC